MEDKKLYMKVLALMAVTVVSIVSMAAILVHERGRMREIEAETGEIQEIRRDITVAQRSITTLEASSAGKRRTTCTTAPGGCGRTACCKP